MAGTSSPYGFQPISDLSGTPRTLRVPNGIASGYAANIFKFQPVTLNVTTGLLTAVTLSTQQIFGIFAGVEFTPTGGSPSPQPFWPSGSVYDSTQDMFAYVWPAWLPGTRFRVQADGSVAQALLGNQFIVSNFTSGSTSTGLSACTVAAAGVNQSSQGQFALQEFDTGVSSVIGDSFTDLIVTIAYPQIGLGYQTSAG